MDVRTEDGEGDGGVRQVEHLDKDVSVRICTAQVVVSLASAVRQMVDNSIDAGATIVEVRAVEFGYDLIEVTDNGGGIESSNFDTLCKPHATSKLSSFDDLRELSTLGFRGEALNALCALGSVVITTRHASSPVGCRLTFDHRGGITKREDVARPIGTTVCVSELFSTLPVRRRELQRTAKREFTRLLSCLQCFALCRPDVRLVCHSWLGEKRHQSLCTPGGSSSIEQVVANLFGSRSDKNNIMNIVQADPDEDACIFYGVDGTKEERFADIHISGFVSSCEHGHGRATADRQFIYVNHRPVDYAKVCRAANDVYQQYNRAQYPTLVVYIQVPPDSIDVNVTPDKRTVFFDREKELLTLIRSSILKTFAPLQGVYGSVQDKRAADQAAAAASQRKLTFGTSADASASQAGPSRESQSGCVGVPSVFDILKDCSFLKSQGKRGRADEEREQNKRVRVEQGEEKEERPTRMRTLEQFAFKLIPHVADDARAGREPERPPSREQRAATERASPASTLERGSQMQSSPAKERRLSDERRPSPSKMPLGAASINPYRVPGRLPLEALSRGFQPIITAADERVMEKEEQRMEKEEQRMEQEEQRMEQEEQRMEQEERVAQENQPTGGVKEEVVSQLVSSQELAASQEGHLDEDTKEYVRPKQKIAFSMDSLRQRLSDLRAKKKEKREEKEHFSTGIDTEQEQAEKELQRKLKKTDFARMRVCGQFNNGFIVCRLEQQLFIVDQHASDEKFNFERLQKRARIESQKLMSAMPLSLGAVMESVLRDNVEVLRANGFEFRLEDDSPALLTSVPVLQGWQFDRTDIDELLEYLQQHPGSMYRPSRLRKVFASRACRKSVMIGTVLTRKEMNTIVNHLGELDMPWACPHGRPTLRHLVSL